MVLIEDKCGIKVGMAAELSGNVIKINGLLEWEQEVLFLSNKGNFEHVLFN